MTPNQLLKKLRVDRAVSQAELADALGMSRTTYTAFEQDKRELTLSEAERAARYFGTTIDSIVLGKEMKKESISFKTADDKSTPGMRISVPKEAHDKFREVLLFILGKTAGKPNVGMTVLYKLLYFIDIDFYEKYGEQLMGLRYMKNHYGPTPRKFAALVEKMQSDGDLEEVKSLFFKLDQRKFLPHKQANLSILSGRELEMIEDVLVRYSDKTASELTKLAHEDTPWKAAKEGKDIDYEHAFYRPDNLSVGSYEEL